MRSGFAEQVFTALMDAYDLYGEQEYLDFDALSDEMAQEIEMLEHEEQLLEMLNIRFILYTYNCILPKT
jgi:hypothetical protein